MQSKPVLIASIRVDGGTQSREKVDALVVAEYAQEMKDGIEFPPVTLFFDGVDHWVADGFHRLHAHTQIGRVSIQANVHTGTSRDAILYAVGANDGHGLRRTNGDKRKCVSMLLADMQWCRMSENEIANRCKVSRALVKSVMDSLHLAEKQDAVIEVVRNGKAYTQNTKGLKAKAKPARELPKPIEPPEPIESENTEIIRALVEDNQSLTQRLAVAAMDATPEERAAATDLIAQLRSEVVSLRAERDALAAGRNAMQAEVAQMRKQIDYWKKKAEKYESTQPA